METEFCKIEYIKDLDAVLCRWKKYCSNDDSQILKQFFKVKLVDRLEDI